MQLVLPNVQSMIDRHTMPVWLRAHVATENPTIVFVLSKQKD